MRYWRHWQSRGRRNRWLDSDLERGVLAVLILMALVLFAIGIGTMFEMIDAGSLP